LFVTFNNSLVNVLIHLENAPKSNQLKVDTGNLAELNNLFALTALKTLENAFNLFSFV
jgi:hypothetical protein